VAFAGESRSGLLMAAPERYSSVETFWQLAKRAEAAKVHSQMRRLYARALQRTLVGFNRNPLRTALRVSLIDIEYPFGYAKAAPAGLTGKQ
jgi:hypothetical protein